MSARIPIDKTAISAFCRKWHLTEFALFGSVIRDDFGPESDVDVLVTFAPDANPSLFDLADMKDELTRLFGRSIDLGTKRSLKPTIKEHVVATAEVIFAA